MCCLIAIGAFIPRVAMVFMAIFGTMFNGVFPNWILPVVGWFLVPYTTLSYVLFWNWQHGHLNFFAWAVVAIAFVVDIGNLAGGVAKRNQVPGYPSGSATY